jgi:hypothetical protein
MSCEQEMEELYKIVCGIIAKPESAAFHTAVAWKELGLLGVFSYAYVYELLPL